jgi:hypothetical protein
MLSGPLYWLGVVEWGRGPEQWDRVRVTEQGAAWLGASDAALVATPEPLELADDLRVVAPSGCDLGPLWRLEPYLTLERRAPTSAYRLERAAFGRGLAAGGSARELVEQLESAAARPLPAAFRAALAGWDVRAGRFKLRPAVLLLADDEQELTRVLGQLEGSELIRERLGPRAAAVGAARAPELAAALDRLGHLPELDAALRLMAGRRAYSALVDQETLETLLLCLRLVRALDPALAAELAPGDRLSRRLEQALGPIATGRIVRRARSAARRLRPARRPAPRPSDEGPIAESDQ